MIVDKVVRVRRTRNNVKDRASCKLQQYFAAAIMANAIILTLFHLLAFAINVWGINAVSSFAGKSGLIAELRFLTFWNMV